MTENTAWISFGAIIVVVDWVSSALRDFMRYSWQERLRLSGELWLWWIMAFLVSMIGYAALFTLSYLILRKGGAISRITPQSKSLLLDFTLTQILWSLGVVLKDPLLEEPLSSVGLVHLSEAIFCLGALWFGIGILRLKMFSKSKPE